MKRSGLSLIEVVASIALLALLMVSLLMGWKSHQQLAEFSQQKLDAAERLDEQLGRWFALDGGPPVGQQGILSGSDFQWISERSPNQNPLPVTLTAVTITVNSPRHENLLRIEVAVPSRLAALNDPLSTGTAQSVDQETNQ